MGGRAGGEATSAHFRKQEGASQHSGPKQLLRGS
jgi:hypothetical protein